MVDPALRELTLLQSANKASAVGTLPMEALVHGIIQDDEGKTYPPYEITWDEFRVSGVKRRAWLENRLKEDPARVYQTLMIFELADGPRDAASALSRKKMPKFQACLPGKLAGPDVKNTTEQKAKLLSEYVGNDDWNVSIALPADAVAALYKVPSCGLPSELDPNANPDVVYGVIEKMEDYAAKDPRVTIYKVAPDNASGAASGGGGSGAAAAIKKPRIGRPNAQSAGGGDAAPGPQRSLADGHRAHAAASRGAGAAPPAAAQGEADAEAEAATPAIATANADAGAGVVRGSFLETDLEFVSCSLSGRRVRYFAAAPNHRVVAATQLGSDCVVVVTEPIA